MGKLSLTRVYESSRYRLLVLSAALVFLALQTVDLQHSHDGDLNLQADCHICLKLGSQHLGVVADAAVPVLETAPTHYEFTLPVPVTGNVLAPRSRAPPLTA